MKGMAQDSTKPASPVTFSAYVETYYSYDFNNPADHIKPGFIYSYNRHNEVNINLAYLKASYNKDNIRGNVTLMAGTYPEYNLATEPTILRHIYEANIGVKLAKNLWVDAGVMPSHIGFESAVGKDCYTLTRSIVADNTPYYEAGAKLTWTPNDRWTFAALYVNGWQRIARLNDNQTPCGGTQITYKPNDKVLLNYSTYFGNDRPDSLYQFRFYNDFYGTFNLTEKWSLIAGFDYGMQQRTAHSSDYATWYAPTLIAHYAINQKYALTGRVEAFKDKDQVVYTTNTPHGFDLMGYSLSFDIVPAKNVLFRIGGRLFSARDDMFRKEQLYTNNDASVTTALMLSF